MQRVTARLLSTLACAVAVVAAPASAFAQEIEGVVTTQNGTIRLAGARVAISEARGGEVASQLTDNAGHFRISGLGDGVYTLTATLDGFRPAQTTVTVARAASGSVALDLALATVNQTIEVAAPLAVVSVADTLAVAEQISGDEAAQMTGSGGVSNALRLLASVIEVPGGVSIKGGRPSQAGMQMGASTLTDPALGLVHLTLPDDAIDSVAVMPNPYAVEYGRFSSGLVMIQTRRGGDSWHARVDNLSPTFRPKRHKELFTVAGISSFGPNGAIGGPIIKGRLFLAQTVQYRYSTADVPSRPEDERRTTHWVSAFTRLDANVSPRHSLVVTAGLSPGVTTFASLGTFTPPAASVDTHDRVQHGTVTERSLWSDRIVSESTVQLRGYRGEVSPQGSAPMELRPDITLGNFFNRQIRTPTTFQVIQTVSGTARRRTGLHLYKVGLDVLANDYDGTSSSRPMLIERPDGTLARRLDFTAPSRQALRSTDVAVFAQDRVQPGEHWFVEYGVRVDRDGIIDRWNITPRVGSAIVFGRAVVRGGYGLFYERTPSAAGAFEQFERPTETRFETDGITPLGPAIPFAYRTSPDLRTPRSATWDLSYEYRWRPSLTFRAAMLDRRGDDELILDSIQSGASGVRPLTSSGRSRYHDVEVGVHASRSTRADFHATYAHAHAEGDLNAFASFFDSMLWPVVTPNQYGPLPTDVRHRLLARGRLLPAPDWLVVGVADWRSGTPYSIVNESLDVVGARNRERMPAYFRLDVGLDHRFTIGKLRPWVGVRAYNALNAFLPTDVQANIASPAFGSFYNSPFREFRLQVRFGR